MQEVDGFVRQNIGKSIKVLEASERIDKYSCLSINQSLRYDEYLVRCCVHGLNDPLTNGL